MAARAASSWSGTTTCVDARPRDRGRARRPPAAARLHARQARPRAARGIGRPLYEALREQVEEDWVWQVSHVGGDRFAGNVVVLPAGVYLGRVEPGEAWEIGRRRSLAGRVPLDRYRGRSCHSFPVQAAERAVREATGLLGLDDLRLGSATEREGGGWRVRFEARRPGEVWEVDVERRDGRARRT